jgi:RNA polymerase sigma-70 factor (ECF subfamily)
LLGIVHHKAMKALRHIAQPLDVIEETMPEVNDSPEELAQTGETKRWIRQGLKSLSTEHRAVLELVFYQGLSLNEVAEVCNCPLGTVKSRLSYARQHLRGVLRRNEEN